MEVFIEYLSQGLFLGVVYGLIAIPLTLVYITTDSIDLAVGGYAVLAGVIAAVTGGFVGALLGIASAVFASSIVGLMYLLLARKRSPDPTTVVLAAFGLLIAIGSFVLWQFGPDPFVTRMFADFWAIGTIRISPQGFINFAVAGALLAALYLVLYRSGLGRSMRASAINPLGAGLAGIPVRYVQLGAFLAGGLIAGIAGVLVLYTTGLDYTMGLHLGVLGVGSALIFGLSSPMRAFGGGLAIGVVEALAGGYFPGGMSAAIPMLFILAALAFGGLSGSGAVGARP